MPNIICVLAFTCSLAFGQPADLISGRVTDDAGRPVAGAKVYYNNIRAFTRDSRGRPQPAGPLLSGESRTSRDGTFEIRGLAGGNYRICIDPARPDLLPTCTWGGDLPLIAPGEHVPVQLRVAASVIIHVEDPQGRLRSTPFTASLIREDGEFETAEPHGASQNGRSFRVAAPRGARLELLLDTDLRVVEANGRPVPARVPATAVETGSGAEIRLRVTE